MPTGRKSNPKAVRPRNLMYCLHKPDYIVTTNPDRSVLITIITWHFQFHLMNVSILHLKYEYGAKQELFRMLLPLLSHMVPLTKDTMLVTCFLTPSIAACLYLSKNNFITIKHIHNESETIIEVVILLLTPMIARISDKWCQWLAMRVWWHTLVFVICQITWHHM